MVKLKNSHIHKEWWTQKCSWECRRWTDPYLFKLGVMTETTYLYILIPVHVTLTFIPSHRCMKKIKTFVFVFLQISLLIWMKCSMLPQIVGLLRLMLNLFCMINIWRVRTWPGWLFKVHFQHYFGFGHLWITFFQSWCDDRTQPISTFWCQFELPWPSVKVTG